MNLWAPIERGLSLRERFEKYVELVPFTTCWVWCGALFKDSDYGSFFPNGRGSQTGAHRVSYELYVRPIPDGLVIDHLCRNHWCVNPRHLEPVTVQVNNQRGIGFAGLNVSKTHCPAGHRLEPGNLLSYEERIGKRSCKQCRLDRERRRYQPRQRGARARALVSHTNRTVHAGLPRGVYLKRDRFSARLCRGGRIQHLGTFDTPEAAAAARERAVNYRADADRAAALAGVSL